MYDVLIIGGGLSGLRTAQLLQAAGLSWHLVEARSRLGGRIKSTVDGCDLGPSWYWPGQPRIAALLDDLGLASFPQYASGSVSFEDVQGRVQRDAGFASMAGSLRVTGGLGQLISTIAAQFPADRMTLETQIDQLESGMCATSTDGQTFHAKHVVIALPPRLAHHTITFAPDLPHAAAQAMAATPTWMAGQAKAVAVYDRPFWRDAGLSGDAMSRRGPLVEIHDASAENGTPAALFGFIGVPAAHRQDENALRVAILAQLSRLFGPHRPQELHITDWAYDAMTATQDDHAPLVAHPNYGHPDEYEGLFDGRLHFAGTEVGTEFGGYIEGALEAAEAVVRRLT